MTGSLFIITAASGTGKTSLVKQLLATTNDLTVSVSHTTRAPRPGEMDGHDYHFTEVDDFITAINDCKFLEHAEVPPSLATLRQRLSTRAQDSIKVIERRLAGAVTEMAQYVHFDFVIINDNFEVALAELKAIIVADRQTLKRQQQRYHRTIATLLNK